MQPAVPDKVDAYTEWDGGISDYDKNADRNEYAFGRSINYRDNKRELTLLPKTVRESGTVVQDLPKDGDRVGSDVFYYGGSGNIYRRTLGGYHSMLRSVSSSHGNGMKYYTEDSYLYYTSDKLIGRYGQLSPNPAWYENWKKGIDTEVWNNWGGAQVTADEDLGILTLGSSAAAAYYGIEKLRYNLTGSFVVSQLLTVGSRSLTSWEVYPVYVSLNSSNECFWFIDKDNNLKAQKKVAGVTSDVATGTYDSGVHKFFRIREANGTMYWEYSTDFNSWINFGSAVNPIPITNLRVGVQVGTWQAEASTTSASFGFFGTGVSTIATPKFADDFLGSEGGIPLNTHALDLEAASSQYASRADTAPLSITSDLAIEGTIIPESLPAVGSSMVIWSKWDVNANKRSYKFEIYAVSGFFGDGSDGALTISSNTTKTEIDSSCTGGQGGYTLLATNASFAAGQLILIHQTKGSNAGVWERNKIAAYTAGTITLETALKTNYTSGAQVLVIKQYTNVTVNAGVTWSAKTYDGTVGGILTFVASGTVTVNGTVSASGKGYRGAPQPDNAARATGKGGEGYLGTNYGTNMNSSTQAATPVDNGGTGAYMTSAAAAGSGGGGGSYGGIGGTGNVGNADGGARPGQGGLTCGGGDLLSALFFGGGGGSGSTSYTGGGDNSSHGGVGGAGGGAIMINGATVLINTGASVISGGDTGGASAGHACGNGGGGAGGSVIINCQTGTLGTGLITCPSGAGGSGGAFNILGGAGGTGRVHVNYLVSYSGTSTPSIYPTQDNNLVTTTTYQLRLGLSSNGTAEEFLTKNANLAIGQKSHVGVSWDASDHEAEFTHDGVSLGTSVGAATSLNDNASTPAIGADFNSTARNFYDGIIDELRIWNTERTASQFFNNKDIQIAVNSVGLVAYYQLNNTYDDATSNAAHLTDSGGPVFTTAVPFSSPTARLDLDQSLDTSGNTYALTTAISESAANRQTFVPNRDPQKSIEVNVSDTGDDSDWTLTVHDSLNRVVAQKTITHANLRTGDVEFVFDKVWRPIRGASYHFHLTATTTTGTPLIVSTSSNDLETADFHTYYQFLVEDEYHGMEQILNVLAVANERYVATYAADAGYNPHRIVLPSGWRVRCFALWRGLLAIGCTRGSNIYDTDQGMIFLWDGYTTTYTDTIPVPEGGVNALLSSRGILYVWAGYHGDMLAYRGGDYAEPLKRVPKMVSEKYIETLPKATSMWDGMLRWGVAGGSNSEDVQRGVYTWGKRKSSNNESLSYDFPLSTGNRASSTIKVGFLYPIDRKLLVGWQDGVTCGMDVIDPEGDCFATGTVEKDIKDYGAVWKEKKALLVRGDFEELEAGQTVTLKYRLNRSAAWVEGETTAQKGYASEGDTVARLPIPMGNNKEIEFAADIGSTSGVSPTLLGLALEFDPKRSEKIV